MLAHSWYDELHLRVPGRHWKARSRGIGASWIGTEGLQVHRAKPSLHTHMVYIPWTLLSLRFFCQLRLWPNYTLTCWYADSRCWRGHPACSAWEEAWGIGIPYMMLMGILALHPNRYNGLYPVVRCTLVLYAIHRHRRCPSHLKGCCWTTVANMSDRVQLMCSTRPLQSGWYGVVRVFAMPRSLLVSVMALDSNCLPWSEWSCFCWGEANEELTSELAVYSGDLV